MTDTPPAPDATATDRATDDPSDRVRPETRVPEGETPTATCPYCERPFTERRLRDLHVGASHDDITAEERESYEAARDDEGDDLFVYHLMIIGALVAVYAALVILYMIVLAQ
jgi:hypothetical protein